jgi:hypothetical protein
MLSVTMPVNFCLPGAAASTAIARRLKINGFIPNLCDAQN